MTQQIQKKSFAEAQTMFCAILETKALSVDLFLFCIENLPRA